MRTFLRRYWPPLVWMIIIYATSCTVISSRAFVKTVTTQTPVHLTERQFGSFWGNWWWLFVKGYHVLEYTILFLLLAIISRTPRWVAALITVLYACTDEYHQTYIPRRGGHMSDVLIDCGGILLGLAVSAMLKRPAGDAAVS